MFKRKINLNQLQVKQPCSTDWESMAGDDSKRYCGECNKNVYNISAMTRGEAEALVRDTNGKFCARIVRDTDGSVVTAMMPVGVNLVNLRASKWASAVVTTMLSLGNQATAQTPIQINEPQVIQSEQPTKQDSSIPPQSEKSIFKGTIFDASKTVIEDAEIVLTNLKTGEEFRTQTSDEGTFQFISLDRGLYKLKVQSRGFVTFHRNLLPIQGTRDLRMNITLQVGTVGGAVYVGQPGTYEKFKDRVMQPFRFVKNFLEKFI